MLNVAMLKVAFLSVIYADCRYAECHHADCRSAAYEHRPIKYFLTLISVRYDQWHHYAHRRRIFGRINLSGSG